MPFYLQKPEILALLKQKVEKEYRPAQMELEGVLVQPDIEDIVAKTTEMVIQQTIDIPRIVVLCPKSEVRSGFKPFQSRSWSLKLSRSFGGNYGFSTSELINLKFWIRLGKRRDRRSTT